MSYELEGSPNTAGHLSRIIATAVAWQLRLTIKLELSIVQCWKCCFPRGFNMSGCILKISDLMLKLRWPRPTPALPEPVLHMEEMLSEALILSSSLKVSPQHSGNPMSTLAN